MTMLLSATLSRERFMPAKIGGSLLNCAGIAVALGGAALVLVAERGSPWPGTLAAMLGLACVIAGLWWVLRPST